LLCSAISFGGRQRVSALVVVGPHKYLSSLAAAVFVVVINVALLSSTAG